MYNHGPLINLPFSHQDDFIERYTPPPMQEMIFSISAESTARIKSKANSECNTTIISSFQALSALIWRSITRSHHLPADQETSCRLAIDNRSRLLPPSSKNYFGNCLQIVRGTTTASELLSNNLGWSAWLLHKAISKHTDKEVRKFPEVWVNSPFLYQYGRFFDVHSMMMGSSPRFKMYNNDFGLGTGKPVAIRRGSGSKFDGKAPSYPGREGGGSLDIEVCLSSESMSALLSDAEFMEAVHFP